MGLNTMEGFKNNNEEPKKIIDPMDLPKPLNPELEQYVAKVFESHPEALTKKNELSSLLNTDPFDETLFRKLVEDFEQETENTKGYTGQYTTIETIRAKHGQLRVYHFRGSDSVKFGYTDLK